MISFSEIEHESLRSSVSLQTIEKDYHLDWYLAVLWKNRLFPECSFYGGTAIKKLYVPHHRFSEDIDLISEKQLPVEELARRLGRANQFLEKEANLFYSFRTDDVETMGMQTRFLIHYRGFSEIGGVKRFLLDFALGIEELPKPVSRKLITTYRDLSSRRISIRALPLEVICADKLALIVDRKRKEPRDIYDLWSALMQTKTFDRKLFAGRFLKVLAYAVEFPIIRSSLKDFDFKRAWEVRLKHQVARLPDFEVVVLELTDKLSVLLKGKNG